MVERTFNILFKSNIGELVTKSKSLGTELEKQISQNSKLVNSGKSQLNSYNQINEALNQMVSKSDRTADEMEQLEKASRQVSKNIKDIESPFETILSDLVPFGGLLVGQNQRLNNLADAFGKVEEAGGFTNVLSDYMANFGSKVTSVGASIQNAFGGGFTGIMSTASASISSLGASFTALLPILAPIAVAIGAIIIAIFTLQRMWANNVGGMQTTFNKFIATTQQIWNRFVVKFDRALRAIGPIVKIIIDQAMRPLFNLLNLISGLIDGLFYIIMPIADAIGEVGSAFSEIFNIMGDGQDTFDMFKILGGTLKFIGQIIGSILKVTLRPFIEGFKILASIIGFILTPFKALFSIIQDSVGQISNFGDLIQTSFDNGPINIFKGILEFIQNILNGIFGTLDGIKTAVSDAFNIEPLNTLLDGIGVVGGAVSSLADTAGGLLGDLGEGLASLGGAIFGESPQAAQAQAATSSLQSGPISTSQITRNNANTVNNNNNVVVNSSGPISQEAAPGIGNIISSMLTTNSRL